MGMSTSEKESVMHRLQPYQSFAYAAAKLVNSDLLEKILIEAKLNLDPLVSEHDWENVASAMMLLCDQSKSVCID